MSVPISYSLYSSREFLPISQTLDMITDLGYTEAEGFHDLVTSTPKLVDALVERGLRMPSFHVNWAELEGDLDKTIAMARKLSATHIYSTYLLRCDRPETLAEWRHFAARLAVVGDILQSHGLTFGWHNHGYEFEPLEDGSLPIDIILAGAPRLSWQADLAWISRVGLDPLPWLKRYSKRVSAVHIKDTAHEGDRDKEGGWADVGHGSMCWPTLLKASLETSAQQFVIEHGDPSDHERFAARSIDTVAANFWDLIDSTGSARAPKAQRNNMTLVS